MMRKRPVGRPRKYADNAARCRAYRKRKKRPVYWRHDSDLWSTPREFFAELDATYHFTLDPCALPENATCATYFTPEQDGLAQDWGQDTVFCNPPYSQVA